VKLYLFFLINEANHLWSLMERFSRARKMLDNWWVGVILAGYWWVKTFLFLVDPIMNMNPNQGYFSFGLIFSNLNSLLK